jgi:hypothetical protein
MLKKIISKTSAYIGVLPVLLLPMSVSAALADNTTNLNQIQAGGAALSGTVSLPTMIGRIIGVILGILGIILVFYIIQAGIMFMTAAGDATKVDKAKKIITQAVIGMVIIVMAYTISNFVIGQLSIVGAA